MTARVLVTDGEQRAALAVVRSLGAAGYECLVASSQERCLAGASRFARETHRVPAPLLQPDAFRRAIRHLARERRADVLLPVTEAALRAVQSGGDPGAVVVPFPPHDAVAAVSDKATVLAAARELGIPVPEQTVLLRAEDAEALRAAPPAYPVAVKPARSVPAEPDGPRDAAVRYAGDTPALRAALDQFPPSHYPLLVQRRVRGPGLGIFLLLWDGRVRAQFAHRRLRERPPSGGVSVLSESVAAEPRLVTWATALLGRFAWRGVAMVEFKQEIATGIPYLMEVNGRFWGSLQLAVDAGVDFPKLLVDAALGGLPEGDVPAYREGVRLRWLWGDVDHLLARLRAPGNGRLAACRDFLLGFRPGNRSEVLRLRDPAPFLRETADWFRALR